jgi:hypothetical protein
MINSRDLVFVFFLSSSTLFVTTIGFAIACLRARERALRAEGRARPLESSASTQDRLERAVDAIALEVERISEGQRFVTRLLAESSSQRQSPHRLDTPRVITPH